MRKFFLICSLGIIEFLSFQQNSIAQKSDSVTNQNLMNPLKTLKPITNSTSKFLLGVCNQIDPQRKVIMENKYKK